MAFYYILVVMIGILISSTFTFIADWAVLIALLITVITAIIIEIVGAIGYGNHWREYRPTLHLAWTGIAVSLSIGIFLGSLPAV